MAGAPPGRDVHEVPRFVYCLDCGYDLQGLGAGECPECGRPFDPDVFSSYTSFHEPAWVKRLPSRRVMYAAAAVMSLVVGRAVMLAWPALGEARYLVGFAYPFWVAGTTAMFVRAILGGRAAGFGPSMLVGLAVGTLVGLPDWPVGAVVSVVLGAATGFFYAYAESLDMVGGR